jgi:hypothetical protein
MRAFFKTTKVHHCFSQELNEPQPKKCKCRKFISKEFAGQLVQDGVADWIIKYPEGISTHDIIMKGIVGKTPRAQTIEKAHMQRYIDGVWNLGNEAFDDPEVMQRLEAYHDIEMVERLKLFHNVGMDLVSKKNESDGFGTLTGAAGKVLNDKFMAEVDQLKFKNYPSDHYIGRAVLMAIGSDQRSTVGRDVEIGEEKLDNS